MDPAVAQRLRKFGSENMQAFYFDTCEELVKYPSLSLAEVMCVFATLSTHKERDEALWRLLHKEEVPTASKKESVKSRLSMPPPPSPSHRPSPRSSPSPSKRRLQNDDEGTSPKKPRMENHIRLSPYHPHLKLNGLEFYLCGDSQMVRFSEFLRFKTGRDKYSMTIAGPLCRGGAKISDVINRVRQIATPENMIVLVGINNITRDREAKEKAHFKTLMRELCGRSINSIVLTLPLHKKLPEDHQTNIRIKELNNQIIHEERYKNVKALDISAIDNDANNFLSDGVHISCDGFQYLQGFLEGLVDGGEQGSDDSDDNDEQGCEDSDVNDDDDHGDRTSHMNTKQKSD